MKPISFTCLEQIAAETASFYGVPLSEVKGPSRLNHIVGARMVAMYLSRHLSRATLEAVGTIYGGRHHTTVLHAVVTVEREIATSPELAAQVLHIKKALSTLKPVEAA